MLRLKLIHVSKIGPWWYLITYAGTPSVTLHWRHNDHDGVSNHQPHDCLLNRYSGSDQRKHQSSVLLAFGRGIHRGPVNSPHKWPVTRKMFPFDDVIMNLHDPCPSTNQQAYLSMHTLLWYILSWLCQSHLFKTLLYRRKLCSPRHCFPLINLYQCAPCSMHVLHFASLHGVTPCDGIRELQKTLKPFPLKIF